MNKINTAVRTDAAEIMDDFELQGEELRKTLNDLNKVNRLLGGDQISITGIKKLLSGTENIEISIADIGCGNGGMLRELAKWGRKKGYNFKLVGIDANPHATEIGRELSSSFPEIAFHTENVFDPEFKNRQYDIILCTLTLHHFKDEQIINLLKSFYHQVNIGIVINDLQRSKTAYRLFQAFCSVFINNEIAREDGLTSILRGFKKDDILTYSQEMPSAQHFINWRWAFRYLWVIKKRTV